VLNLRTISAMYALGSWLVPRDEIRLYANDMQRSYTEYASKTRIEPTEATGIYSFVFMPYMCWNEFETFDSSSDQIRLMAFYLHTDVIDVTLQTIHSISDETATIKNDLKLTCTDN